MWNLNESIFTPRYFAALLCDDLGIGERYMEEISKSLMDQIEESREWRETIVNEEEELTEEEVEQTEGMKIVIDVNKFLFYSTISCLFFFFVSHIDNSFTYILNHSHTHFIIRLIFVFVKHILEIDLYGHIHHPLHLNVLLPYYVKI